jgi:hypothetical protein
MGRHFLILVSLCIYSSISFGVCSDSSIADTCDALRNTYKRERSRFAACKKLPYFENRSLIAIAERQEGTEIGDSDTMGIYDLNIDLIDDCTGTVLKSAYFERRFTSDGYRFDGIEIDTANYTVAPKLRAIGIRASYHIDLGFTSSQSLSLYVPSGSTFKEILSDATMSIFFTNQALCSETREATRILAIKKQTTQDYFDLLVTETLVDTHEYENKKHGGDESSCNYESEQETKKYILRYDGSQYVIPREMSEFDCRLC